MKDLAKRGLALLLSAHLLLDPLIAYAGGVTPDAAAPAANRPSLDSAANGVPMVNIVAPNGSGLSHNKFTDFNVGTSGLILNNSQAAGVSKLGGVVLGNPNLTAGTASLILAEVTGANASLLQGVTEVFGAQAAFVLANANGITCQGCGFVNTPRVTLSTGTPTFDAAGALSGLDLRQGAVLIDGAVLDVTGLDSFDIVSRTASLNAAIKAQSLGVFTGSGHFDYAARRLSGDGTQGTGVSIDSTALGGMYANRIILVGTDRGVGVNLQAEAEAADSLVITADGRISAQRLKSGGAMSIASASAAVVLTDVVYAGSTLSVSGAEVANSGTAGAAADVSIAAGSLSNDGQLVAGLAADGTVTSGTGSLSVAAGQVGNSGRMQSGRATVIDAAGTVGNATGASIASLGDAALRAAALDNQGEMAAGGALSAAVAGTLSNAGRISAVGAASLAAGSLTSTGAMVAGGALGLSAAGAAVIAAGASVVAGGDLAATAGSLDNAGSLSAGGAFSLRTAGDLTNRAAGRMAATGPMTLAAGLSGAGGTLRQAGQLSGTGAVGLSGPRLELDAGGVTAAATSLVLSADSLTVAGGASGQTATLTATGDLSIAAGGTVSATRAIGLSGGTVTNGGAVDSAALTVTAGGAVTNQLAGSLVGRDSLTLAAASLENDGGIGAGPSLALTLGGRLVNSGTLEATGDATLQAGDMVNSGVVATNGRLGAGLASLSNTPGGILSAGTTLDLTAGSLSNGGTMVAGGAMILRAGAASNAAGAILASGGTLSATLASLDNRGAVSAGGLLDLGTTGAFGNGGSLIGAGAVTLAAADLTNGGTIASGGLLTATLASLTNNQGGIVSGGTGLGITLSGGLSNAGTLVSGGDFTLRAADPLNSGNISAVGELILSLADLTNQGTLSGGTGLSLTLTSGFLNYGSLTSGGGATVRASGLANYGLISAATALDVAVTGDLANAGRLVSGATARLQAASLENGAVISGGAGLAMIVSGALSNSGNVDVGGDLTLQAASLSNGGSHGIVASGAVTGALSTLDNRAPLIAGGALTLTGLSNLDNYALMLADGAMRVEVAGAFGNWGGALLSGGAMSITGAGGGQAGSITNLGGSLETVSGNMVLSAGQVTNQASGELRTTNSTIYENSGDQSVPRGPCTYGKGTCDSQYWSHWYWVVNPTGSDAGAWYGSSNGISIRSWIVESGSSYSGTAASISSGGTLSVSGGTIANVYSTISSAGTMDLSGGSLSNAGGQTVDSWYISSSTSTMTRCYGGYCSGFGNGGGTALLRSWVSGQQGGRIVAGGALTGSFTGQIDNVSIQQYAAVSGSGSAATASPALTSASGVSIGNVVGIGTGQVATTSARGHSGAIDLVTGTAADGSPLLPQAAFPTTMSALTAALSRRIAGFSAKFAAAPASSAYLYETRFQYTDLGTFYGSDYFFARMGVGTSSLPKRLGDAYMDTSLVSQAVINQTGQKYLSSSYTSDSQQMQALLDNAVAESSADHLTVGQALSTDQIANLTSDIVWYVNEVVDGQTVLVPTLYLADSSKINATGATIASGGNATLSASSVTNQGGAVTAAANLVVSAKDTITDVSGLLKAGGDVSLTAGQDVSIATRTVTMTGSAGDDRTVRVGQGAVTAGGNLTVSAGNDVTVTGADLSAKGGATLAAGNDVTVATNTLSHDEVFSDSHSHAEQHDVTHDTSSISAGQGLTVTAGRDVAVSGGVLSAGSDVAVSAGGSLSLSAVTDSYYAESNSSKSGGFMNSSKSRSESQTVSNRGASVTAGGSVTLTSGTDLTLQAAQVTAGGDLALNAGGTLSLLSATDSSYLSQTSSKSSAAWQSTSDKGHNDTTVVMTGLQAGGNLSVNAAKVVADYKSTGDLQASLTALAADPKTAWVAQLATKDAVTWQAVQEAHKKWDHESQGLSAAASAIIAIVVAAVTGGAGLGAMLAEAAGMAGSTVAVAAATAGISTLATQVTTSLINNQGDLGKTFQQLGSLDTVKSIAISMAAAGAFAEVGDLTDGHFGDASGTNAAKQTPSEYFGTANYAENVLGHAAVGCAQAAASGGDCASGAAASGLSATATPVSVGLGFSSGLALSSAIGGAASSVTGGTFSQGAINGAYGYLYNSVGAAATSSVQDAGPTVPGSDQTQSLAGNVASDAAGLSEGFMSAEQNQNNNDTGKIQIAGTDGTPGNNQAQNAQVSAIVRILRLTPDQRQLLHQEISGQNYSYKEILQTAKDMFGK